MPAVTVLPRPKGLPMAITQSPTRVVVLSPNLTKGRPLALIFRTPSSYATSRPINFASFSLRLVRLSVLLSTPSFPVPPHSTLSFFTFYPSSHIIHPHPTH